MVGEQSIRMGAVRRDFAISGQIQHASVRYKHSRIAAGEIRVLPGSISGFCNSHGI